VRNPLWRPGARHGAGPVKDHSQDLAAARVAFRQPAVQRAAHEAAAANANAFAPNVHAESWSASVSGSAVAGAVGAAVGGVGGVGGADVSVTLVSVPPISLIDASSVSLTLPAIA